MTANKSTQNTETAKIALVARTDLSSQHIHTMVTTPAKGKKRVKEACQR
jgi:hypothetical protein